VSNRGRPYGLWCASHLVTTARNLFAYGHTLSDSQQEQVIDALEDMCVRLTQRRRKRWLRHWRRLRGLPTTRR